MCAGSGPPLGARIIDHGTNELLIMQDSFPDGKITLSIRETQQTHPLSSLLSDLNDVS